MPTPKLQTQGSGPDVVLLSITDFTLAAGATLEANGWHHLTSATSSDKGTTQVYEKAGNSLHVLIYEGIYYTWVEVSATRLVNTSTSQVR